MRIDICLQSIRLVSMFVILLCLYACVETKEKSEEKPVLGKYVYVDTQSVLHVKDRCVMGLKVANENGEREYKGVYRIEVASLHEGSLYGIATCPWCVKDEHYELLKEFFSH